MENIFEELKLERKVWIEVTDDEKLFAFIRTKCFNTSVKIYNEELEIVDGHSHPDGQNTGVDYQFDFKKHPTGKYIIDIGIDLKHYEFEIKKT
jgi:hypothetical protein